VQLFGGAYDGEYHEQPWGEPCPYEIAREHNGVVYLYRLELRLHNIFGSMLINIFSEKPNVSSIWGRYVLCGVQDGGIHHCAATMPETK
jgi:hypothetical protein